MVAVSHIFCNELYKDMLYLEQQIGILCWLVSRKGVYYELNNYNSQEMIIQIGIDVVEWIY